MTGVLLALVLILPPAGSAVSVHRMKVTAYCCCPICCEKWSGGGVTSTGRDARLPGVAADPKVLPYGSIVDIPGIGRRLVDDTGGAMRQDTRRQIAHIDVRMATHEEALAWGVQWLEVGVVKYGRAKK